MRYKLNIAAENSRAIGKIGLDRYALLKVLNSLYQELEDNAEKKYRPQRHPTRPDLYFLFELIVWDKGNQRGFRFTLDDARAPGYLFLVAVEEI